MRQIDRCCCSRATRSACHRTTLQRAGFTIVEALVAALIMVVSVMAMISLYSVSFRVTTHAQEQALAYNIGRREMEFVKQSGFDYATTTSYTRYYDGSGNASVSSSVYKVTVEFPQGNGYLPPPTFTGALQVHIIVQPASGNVAPPLYETHTLLAKGGI